MDPSVDPIMQLAGWKSGDGIRGWKNMMYTAPCVTGVLLIAVFSSWLVLNKITRGWVVDKNNATVPKGSALSKQVSFCLVGILIHSYLGPTSIALAMRSLDTPYPVAVGNRAALSDVAALEYLDVANAQAVIGEIFTGYAAYITIMWLLGWEKGVDKIIHHVVFLFLAVLLSSQYAFCRLSAFAISMEVSTVFLNMNVVSGWLVNWKKFHLITGAFFILSFFCTRILFFGYGLGTTLVDFFEDPSASPLPFSVSCLVLFLFSGGWLLQVFWLRPIIHKVSSVFAKKPKQH